MLDETLITPAQATKKLPGRPSLRTVWRWMQRGVKGHRLESVLIGGRRYTSVEAGVRFVVATTATSDNIPSRPDPTSTGRLAIAEKELDEAGIQ
ncbi:MAG: DUF1580 domain-containing protein [Pirellulales bacterium]